MLVFGLNVANPISTIEIGWLRNNLTHTRTHHRFRWRHGCLCDNVIPSN